MSSAISRAESEGLDQRCVSAVLLLFDILAGRQDLSLAATVLDRQVVIHVDGYSFVGIDAWETWISFIRSRRRVSDIEVIIDHMAVFGGDRLVVSGHWQGNRNGVRTASEPCTVSYRFDGGYITEIHTTRRNYAFVFGRGVRCVVFYLLLLGYVWIWARFVRARGGTT